MKRSLSLLVLGLGILAAACGQQSSDLASAPAASAVVELDPVADGKARVRYEEIVSSSPEAKTGLTASERNQLFKKVYENPVANLDMVAAYDPQGLTGFCFGRAMAAHLEARRMGLAEASVKKLFIVGDLKQRGAEKTEWRFHVTTVVRGTEGAWYAIDPIFGRVLPIKTWMQETREIWDTWYLDHDTIKTPQSKMYLVHAGAVLPDIRDFQTVETGKYLIELNFAPEAKPGFIADPTLGERTYRLSDAATDAYFQSSSEAVAADSFHFAGLKFSDGLYIHYNDYFVDLMATMPKSTVAAAAYASKGVQSSAPVRSLQSPALNAVSFDFAKLQALRNAGN